MDFTVHIENAVFRQRGMIDMPSHKDIIKDLKDKQLNNLNDYNRVKSVIDKIYNCQPVLNSEFTNYNFNVGLSIESTLKSIKWLFIEQDITYWNWSGRKMLYDVLLSNGLC